MATTIITRASKGGRLSFTDMDNNLLNLKATADDAAPKSTTLSGYGITDAYTSAAVDSALSLKADGSALTAVITSVAGKASLSGSTAQDFNVKGMTVNGDILPLVSGVSNIGSATQKFGAIYTKEMHIDANTLYVDGVAVLGSSANTIQITADINQGIRVGTRGTGQTVLDSQAATVIQTNGVNADVTIQTAGLGSSARITSGTQIVLTAPTVAIAGDQTVSGALTVAGNFTVNGTTTFVDSTNMQVKDNIITVNKGENGSGVSLTYAGIDVDRGDLARARIVWNETTGKWTTGVIGSESAIATEAYVSAIVTGSATALSTVATTGSYNDLTNKPTIPSVPTLVSAFTNDKGYLIASDVTGKANSATTLAGYGITDAYTKSAVDTAISAKANSATTLLGYGITDAYTKTAIDSALTLKANSAITLSGYGITDAYTKTEVDTAISVATPTFSSLTGKPTTISGYGITNAYTKTEVDTAITAAVPTFSTLTGKPTTAAGYGITDVYTKTAVDTALSAKATASSLATVATSGSYNDLINKPTIPTVPSAVSAFTNDSGYQTAANVTSAIQAVVGAAPAALDTLAEIATQLASDESAVSALTTVVSGKVAANTAITAGTGTKVTYDSKGLVTSSTTLSASDIPSLDWSKIGSGKPTTLSGYGIADAQPLDADLTSIAALAGTSGILKKTAANTWALDTSTYLTGNQSISVTGDVTGTGTTSIALTLATVIDSGTGSFKKVTVNSKGLVTGTASVAQADITGLLGVGSITNTMLANTAVANLSGTNTGDETAATIKTKLGITTLSGSNTGDQTITLTGDATGTGTGSFAVTLANSGVTAGTYPKVTVDAKGRVTSGTTLSASDIPDISATYQPLKSVLTSVGGLSTASTGLVKLTNGVASFDSNTYLTAESDTLATVTGRGNTTATMIKSTNGVSQSLTDGAFWANASGGALLFDDNAHKRISWNDGGGNFNIRSGCYHNGTNLVYAKGAGDANSGATSIVFNGDGSDGQITLNAAPVGVPGATVTWSNTLFITPTQLINPATTASTSTSTGALVLSGGMGVAGNANIGGTIAASNLSGTNTGDETASSIKTKLGVTTLSGSNTGDQTITLTGDATGTGTGSFAVTLANSGVTAGTYKSVTVDAKGRVTAGTNPTTLAGYGITDAVSSSLLGANSGVATLDSTGKVPSSQLPSYVDDVLEYTNLAGFPVSGTTGVIYVAQDTNKIYRWSGSAYIEISSSAGNADTATKLATARSIAMTGDVTWSIASFDGSANVAAAGTLATITDSGTGSFKKVTVNSKGLVTGTASVAQADITGLLGAGSITNTMLANSAVANLSGTNTGDETAATIKTKLGITTLSGSNTGDQTITLTGDATGTGTGSFAVTLANSGVTAGTYKSVTVDTKGRVTAGTNPTTLSGYGITDALNTSSNTSVPFANGLITSATLTTSATTAGQVVDSFSATTYRSAKYVVSVTSGTSYQVSEIMVIHDGTNVFISESDEIHTGAVLATYDAGITTGNVQLLVTPTNAATTFKVVRTTINI